MELTENKRGERAIVLEHLRDRLHPLYANVALP